LFAVVEDSKIESDVQEERLGEEMLGTERLERDWGQGKRVKCWGQGKRILSASASGSVSEREGSRVQIRFKRA
jgi:hypothetical protein